MGQQFQEVVSGLFQRRASDVIDLKIQELAKLSLADRIVDSSRGMDHCVSGWQVLLESWCYKPGRLASWSLRKERKLA